MGTRAATLGEFVRKWRIGAGFESTTALAKALEQRHVSKPDGMKITRQDLNNLESGKVESPRYLPQLAQFMGISLDDLHGGRMPAPGAPREVPPGQPTRASPLQARLDGMPKDMREAFEAAMLLVVESLRPTGGVRPAEAHAEWTRAHRIAAEDDKDGSPTRKRQPTRKKHSA
jgi:hypothetical protein